MCLAKVTVGGFAGNNFQVICITKVLAKFLGLNVTPRSFVSGHVVRGERSLEIRHRNQLTAKAWEKAVQELGNQCSTYHTNPRCGNLSFWDTAAILNSIVSVIAIMGRSRSKFVNLSSEHPTGKLRDTE